MSKEKMQIIQDMITHEALCVLATSDGTQPHCSLMHFFADHAAMKFYFMTRSSTQKSRNLKKCPYASILIYAPDKGCALTIDGIASPIGKRQTVDAITRLYLMKHPTMQALADDSDVELIRILGRSATLAQGITDIFQTKLTNS